MNPLSYSGMRRAAHFVIIVALCLSIIAPLLTMFKPAQAQSSATLLPVSDVQTGWIAVPSGTHYTTIDDGATDSTADYVHTGTNNNAAVTDEYALTNTPNVASASKVTITVDAASLTTSMGGQYDNLSINLSVNGTLQTASTTCIPFPANNWQHCSAAFSGSWTSTDTANLHVVLTTIANGSGGFKSRADDFAVANLNAVLYYTPTVNYNQAAYRLFNNQDAASGGLTFAKTTGGVDTEGSTAAVQTSDGGYAMAASTRSYNIGGGNGITDDVLITKYDNTGAISWSKTWGGTTNLESPSDIIQTSDGGYAVTGYTDSFGAGGADMFLLKYDSSGTLSWNTLWGGTNNDYGYQLVQTSDGGYAITGQTLSFGDTNGDVYIAKFTSSGTLSWNKVWSGTGADVGESIVQTSDGGYAITGYTNSFGAGSNDVLLLKYDSSGTLSWSKVWGGTGADIGMGLVQTSDGGYAITGYTNSFGAGNYDMFLLKYDSSGTLSWNTLWGGTSLDIGYKLVQTSDGGYAVTGHTQSFGNGNYDVFLIKYDSTGTLSWNKTFGGAGSDQGLSVVQTSDGGYALGGNTGSYGSGGTDELLIKYDSTGTIGGCGSICQSPTATTSSPTATTSSPSATTSSPTATTSSPSATTQTIVADGDTIVAVTPSADVGTALASQNTAATVPGDGQPFRLRMLLGVTLSQLKGNDQYFKLQYATRGADNSCDTSFSGEGYQYVTDTSNVRYYDNPNAQSGGGVTVNANDPTDGTNTITPESYQEQGTTSFTNPASISPGQDGEWDFGLTTYHTLQNTHYCLRLVTSTGSVLNTYTTIPEIVTPPTSYNQASYRWFSNNNQPLFTPITENVNTVFLASPNVPKTPTILDATNHFVYIAGRDESSGHTQIRLEKRSSDTGALISGFGTGGVVLSDNSGISTTSYSMAFDSSGGYLYILASTTVGGTPGWHVEKRSAVDGSLISGFGTSGKMEESIGTGSNGVGSGEIAIDVTGGNMYLVGKDGLNGDEYRIEKRLLTTGALVSGFGTSGVASESFGFTGPVNLETLVLDTGGGYMYVGGTSPVTSTNYQWQIEKRLLTTGALVSGFGTSGKVTEDTSSSTTTNDVVHTMDIDTTNGYLYIGGIDGTSGSNWRIEKRATSNGALVSGFGSSGVVSVATSGYVDALKIDTAGGYLYAVGRGADPSSGTLGWRIEKRALSDGSLTTGFGTSGVLGTPYYNAGGIALDTNSDYMYLSGENNSPEQWVIEKLSMDTAAVPSPGLAALGLQNKVVDITSLGTPFRLRLNIAASLSGVAASGQSFKLQYGPRNDGLCSAASYSDISTNTPVQWYDNSNIADGSATSANSGDPTNGSDTPDPQTYEESNNFTNGSSTIYAGEDGIWDFSLVMPIGVDAQDICLRVVKSNGTPLDTYTTYPEIQYGPTLLQRMRSGKWFDQNGVRQSVWLK